MNKIKILVVEPEKDPYIKEIENTLEALQDEVYGNIEVYSMENGVDIILNEEGKIDNLPYNRFVDDDIFCGTFIIAGEKDGGTISLNDEQIKRYSEMFEYSKQKEIIEYFKSRNKSPSSFAYFKFVGGC